MSKHPAATAWDKWLLSEDGASCSEPGLIERQYLQNRLWKAFMAGYNSAKPPKPVDVLKVFETAHLEISQFHSTAYPDCKGGCPGHEAIGMLETMIQIFKTQV